MKFLVYLMISSCQTYKRRHYQTARTITEGTYFVTWLHNKHFISFQNALSGTVTFTLFDLKCRTMVNTYSKSQKLASKTGEKSFESTCRVHVIFGRPNRDILLSIRMTFFYLPGINRRIHANVFNHRNIQNYAARGGCSTLSLALI